MKCQNLFSGPKETICMKCQILFSGANKKNINFSSAENAQRVVKVEEILAFVYYCWIVNNLPKNLQRLPLETKNN